MKALSVLVLLLGAAVPGLSAELGPGDFAYGYRLEVNTPSAVYSVLLPEELYKTVRSGELLDIRVFNGAREPVPHDVRVVESDAQALRERGAVPIFPLYGTGGQGSEQAELSLKVSRDAAGAIVSIHSLPSAEEPKRPVTGYLLDLSGWQQGIAELTFDWRKESESSVFTVSLEESPDLLHWSSLLVRETLADLQFGGQRVERRTIALPRRPARYLRLSWQEAGWPLRLTAVTGMSQVIEANRDRRWLRLESGVRHERDGRLSIEFASEHRVPASSLQLDFAASNSIARLSIQSRPDGDSPWRTRCEQSFYDLMVDGAPIRNQPCTFVPTTDSRWRALVVRDGAGLQAGGGSISLRLGWRPSELVFVGRGEPPYLLAFGSTKAVRQGELPAGLVLQTLAATGGSQTIRRVELGERLSLGGEGALVEPKPPVPWRKWLLWAVLLVGVGLLALMTRSLLREMKAAEERKGPDAQ